MTHTAKHTPGPWSVDNTDLYLITSDRDGEAVCEIAEREIVSQSGTWESNVSVMDANAHLIAAAPAMYEALVETMRVLRSLRDNKEEWYTLVTPELLTAWDKNKAALAQAEGCQS